MTALGKEKIIGENKMTLGFDASTTVCGWAMTTSSIIVDCGFIDISNFDTKLLGIRLSLFIFYAFHLNLFIKQFLNFSMGIGTYFS